MNDPTAVTAETANDASLLTPVRQVTLKRKNVRIDVNSPAKNSSTNGASSPSTPLISSMDEETAFAAILKTAAFHTDASNHRPSPSNKIATTSTNMQLYEDDARTMPALADFLRTLGPPVDNTDEAIVRSTKVARLGTWLGVYLPTIQHILGVQMFLRQLWIVGVGGITKSLFMISLCCLCTFFTCISISAIATNGVIESGGAYFLISRNLGPEFGTAVGVLYYLANAMATSMYLVGGVEILLMYIAPDLPRFRSPSISDGTVGNHMDSAMFNNFRLYATGLLVIEALVVSMGVKFVQCIAPISLICVIISILSVYIGSFVASPSTSPMICLQNNLLLKPSAFTGPDGQFYCNASQNGLLFQSYCKNNESTSECLNLLNSNFQYLPGIPGFSIQLFEENQPSSYLAAGQAAQHVSVSDPDRFVVQDITSNFFVILAIFFPSVTGIFTGANMSGDLKDPQKSLPIGTILAQLTTSFVYLSFVVVFGGSIHGALLRDKYGESLGHKMIVAELAWPNEWVLLIGSFTATFGAALQCLCSAPRLLQSLAKDNIIPFLRPFSKLSNRNEPLLALLPTVALAEIGILIGSIDDVAPVVDFFFLMCYAFVNIVCVLQTLLNAPNWRPRFKYYHWTVSLLGAMLCLFIMFATYWYYALVVIVLCASIYKYVEYKGAKKEWGDGIRGLALSTAQYSLLNVESGKYQHPKNWRPQLLVMVKAEEADWNVNLKLLQVAAQLKAGQGLTIVTSLISGDFSHPDDRAKADYLDMKLQEALKQAKVRGFVKVLLCQDIASSVGAVIQSVGLGALRPNTVMVSWPTTWKETVHMNRSHSGFLDAVHRAATSDMCLLIPKGLASFPEQQEKLTGTIDVWWILQDGGLLIMLPFLLKQHKVWRSCKIRVFTVAQIHDNSIQMKKDLERWVYQLRIDASVDVVELPENTISAYTYEKTLKMEERNKLAMDLQLSMKDIAHNPQLLIDRHRSRIGLSALVGDLDRKSSTEYFNKRCRSAVEKPNISHLEGRFRTIPSEATSAELTSPRPSISSESGGSISGGGKSVSPKRLLLSSPGVAFDRKEHMSLINSTIIEENGNGPDYETNDDDRPSISNHSTDSSSSSSPCSSAERLEIQTTATVSVVDSSKNVEQSPIKHSQKCEAIVHKSENSSSPVSGRKTPPRSILKSISVDAAVKITPHKKPPKCFVERSISEIASSATGDSGTPDAYSKLDRKKVRKMHNAVNLNNVIREKSSQAQLVVLNLPCPPHGSHYLGTYMAYLEALTEGLERVLLVRGSGKEVITVYL